MTAGKVYAAHKWPTNGALIADIARLYRFDRSTMHTVDMTYGMGAWWTKWRPDSLVAHDANPRKGDGVDYTALPEADSSVDLGIFDPTYVATGGRSTVGASVAGMMDAYGMAEKGTPRTPAELDAQMHAGLAELYRVLRPRRRRDGFATTGIGLVKCMDYVSSGRLHLGAHNMTAAALALGFDVFDRIEHLSVAGGPQPRLTKCKPCGATGELVVDGIAGPCKKCDGAGSFPRVQRHAKRNYSTLLVLHTPHRK